MNIFIISLGIGIPILLILLGMYFYVFKYKNKKRSIFEEGKILPYKKFKKLQKDNFANSNDIGNFNSGFLIASGIKKNGKIKDINGYDKKCDVDVILSPKSHSLYFGATGSGKTDRILMPNILMNVLSRDQPSGCVFDPKGEIYAKLAPFIRAQGYTVLYLNLSETSMTHRWNPFQYALDNATYYVKFALLHEKLVDRTIEKQLISEKNEKYFAATSSVEETLKTLIDISSGQDNQSIWTSNAKKLFQIVCKGFMENLISKSFKRLLTEDIPFLKELEVTKINYEEIKKKVMLDKKIEEILTEEFQYFNLKNISSVLGNTSTQAWIKFCRSQDWHEDIPLFQSTPEQMASFKMNISAAIEKLAGPDFKDVIAKSDFSYHDFINKKTMLFINIPSSNESRKTIASIMVEQLIRFLESYAKSLPKKTLNRPFYFYLEELANIPKIQSFMQLLTLFRGYNIFAMVIIQSIAQLEKVYDQGAFNLVWDNTMTKNYLLAKNNDDLENISKQFGTKIVKLDDGSGQTRDVPLITPQELLSIKMGKTLCMLERQAPLYTPATSFSNYKIFSDWEYNTYIGDNPDLNSLEFLNIKKKIEKETKKTPKEKEIFTRKIIEDKLVQNSIYTEENNIGILENFVLEKEKEIDSGYAKSIFESFLIALFEKSDLTKINIKGKQLKLNFGKLYKKILNIIEIESNKFSTKEESDLILTEKFIELLKVTIIGSEVENFSPEILNFNLDNINLFYSWVLSFYESKTNYPFSILDNYEQKTYFKWLFEMNSIFLLIKSNLNDGIYNDLIISFLELDENFNLILFDSSMENEEKRKILKNELELENGNLENAKDIISNAVETDYTIGKCEYIPDVQNNLETVQEGSIFSKSSNAYLESDKELINLIERNYILYWQRQICLLFNNKINNNLLNDFQNKLEKEFNLNFNDIKKSDFFLKKINNNSKDFRKESMNIKKELNLILETKYKIGIKSKFTIQKILELSKIKKKELNKIIQNWILEITK